VFLQTLKNKPVTAKTSTATSTAMLGAIMLLSGCAPGPWLRASNETFNFGQELPANMVNVNMIGMVGVDETFSGNFNRHSQAVLYLVVRFNNSITFKSFQDQTYSSETQQVKH